MMDGNQPDTPANSPQLAPNGNFLTDRAGRINLNHFAPGVYHVVETRALPGFERDTTVHVVTVIAGQQTVLEVVNVLLASVIIRKIDSETGESIRGATFLLYDSRHNPIAQFTTDDRGYILIDRQLPEGRYRLREIEAPPGYVLDTTPRTFYAVAGHTTTITWENTPMRGQIIVTKRSADFNEITGLPAGSPLAGATFDIVNTTGNVVDRMTSDARGIAASRLLPPGVYNKNANHELKIK